MAALSLMPMKFILRLFPEISIKSKPVRNRLIKNLQQNLFNVARHHGYTVHVFSQWDKLIVNFDEGVLSPEKAVSELSRIPGIHSFLEVREFPLVSIEDIFEKSRDVLGPMIVGKSFALRVKRRGHHEFTSQQVERQLGGMFKAHYENLGVNLSHPDVTLNVEIDNDKVYIVTGRHKGLGGYPVGSQGEVVSLISGGFDSGVATFDAIRRGLKVNYLFFNMGGTAHELGVKQESYFIWDRYAASHRVKFTAVPFEEVVGQILERTHHGVRGVILKRMMVRVASKIAKRYGVDALVTGESVGQVSSQTLINLSHIDRASGVLVIRPLSLSDKQEIIDKAREIGTAGFAESMPEYCGVISDHPNVCPVEAFILEQEALMDADVVDRAVEKARTLDIRDIPEDTARLETEVETVTELMPGDVILDVRAPDDVERSPLTVEGHEIIALPFYRVAAEFENLDRMKRYALYCDQGVMSLMQARQLKEMGHHNVKVYRKE